MLPEHPPQGQGAVGEVHGRRKRRNADNADAEGASGLKGSSQISHTSSNLSEVSWLGERCVHIMLSSYSTYVCVRHSGGMYVCCGVLTLKVCHVFSVYVHT